MLATLEPALKNKPTAQREVELVTFQCGGLICGIDIREVKEINSCLAVTRAPHARPYVLGAVSLRGDVITVVDLARLLELPASQTRSSSSVIVNVEGQWVALAVEAVLDVVSVHPNDIAPLPPNFRGGQERIFSGVIQREKDLLITLDVTRPFQLDRRRGDRPTTSR